MKHARVLHHGVALEAEASVRYLGVTVDKDLKWDEHIHRARKRCLASLAKLRRIFPSLSVIVVGSLVPALFAAVTEKVHQHKYLLSPGRQQTAHITITPTALCWLNTIQFGMSEVHVWRKLFLYG